MSASDPPFAPPRQIGSLDDCYFYHSMTLPGHGDVSGEWDLRGREADYLGHIDVAGKRILEIGTASGHLAFWMEQRGAEVTGYDLSEDQAWDLVPYAARSDVEALVAGRKRHIRRINNSWWFARACLGAKARVVYGSVYELSPEIGTFDVVTLGSILLHLRDPILAMQKAGRLARETLVVSDVLTPSGDEAAAALLGQGRMARFLPDALALSPVETWWGLSPHLVAQVVMILGFGDVRLSLHRQRHAGGEVNLYTIVPRRGSGPPHYDEGQYARRIAEQFGYEELLLRRIPLPRLLTHLRKRVLERIGVGRR